MFQAGDCFSLFLPLSADRFLEEPSTQTHSPPLPSLAQTLPLFPYLPPHRGSARPLDTPPDPTPALGVDRPTLKGTQLSSRPHLGTRPPHPRINAMALGLDDRPQRAASGSVRPQAPPAPPPGVWEAARSVPLPQHRFSPSHSPLLQRPVTPSFFLIPS